MKEERVALKREAIVASDEVYNLCSNCDEFVTDPLFKCGQCDEEGDVLCETCVVFHCRKNHPILNSKNEIVFVCEIHKLPCFHFCQNCNEAVCFKCFQGHFLERKHNPMKIEKVVPETKSEIREFINSWESFHVSRDVRAENYKMKAKSKEVIGTLTLRIAEYQNVIAKAKNACSQIDESERALEQLSHDFDKFQGNVKRLLEIEDLHVRLFIEKKKEALQLQEARSGKMSQRSRILTSLIKFHNLYNEVSEQEVTKSPRHDGISDVPLSTVSECAAKVKPRFIVGCYYSMFYEVTVEDRRILIYKWKIDKDETVNRKLIGKKQNMAANGFSNVFLYWSKHMWLLVMLFDNQTALSFKMPGFKYTKQVNYPTCDNPLWPYHRSAMGFELFWSYYDKENKRLRFTHNENFQIHCESEPTCKLTMISDMCCFFVPTSKDLIIVFAAEDCFDVVPFSVHRCDVIDCTSIPFNNFELILWSVSAKKLSIIEKSLPPSSSKGTKSQTLWTLTETITWDNDFKILSVEYNYVLRFLPAVMVPIGNSESVSEGSTNEDCFEELKYVFLTEDVSP